MKQLIPVLCSCLGLSSCMSTTERIPDSIYVSAIVDITDHRQVYPDAESILPLFNLNAEENSAATFRICPVTDRELNPAMEFHLSTAVETQNDNVDDDPDFRKKVIVQFFNSIRNAITEFNSKINHDSGYTHSECFKTIAGELRSIINHKASKAALLVYSDLQELSTYFDCYTKANQKLLALNPEKVEAIFEKTMLLPQNLHTVTVYFIYNPISRDDDVRFMAMVKVYKNLLEKRAATVIIQATNQNFSL